MAINKIQTMLEKKKELVLIRTSEYSTTATTILYPTYHITPDYN